MIYEGAQRAVQYCADHKLHFETPNYSKERKKENCYKREYK